MTIDMNDAAITSIDQLEAFLKATDGVDLKRGDTTADVYAWLTDILIRFRYRFLKKREKGIVRTYLVRCTGYTESHVDHLITRYREEGKVTKRKRTQPVFRATYTRADIELLAEVSNAYNHQNGKALKEVCREMYEVYGDERFVRLRNISVSRLYDFRNTNTFKNKALTYTKTKAAAVPIGERKKPYPEGRPGFLRVDSVHQGDRDKEKGVYHINLVDEVTQDEVVVCVEGISEQFLIPALEEAFEQFPYVILNFHSDNGSEYINKRVAELLERLRIKQTKSRSRRTNDQALAESKNGSVVRKQMGYMHIPKKHAVAINTLYREHLNPFLRFHRFCAFPDEIVDGKGKIKKVYKTFLTPVQKLLSLPNVEQYLKPGVTKESLLEEAFAKTHLEAAGELAEAKKALFNSFKKA